MTLASRFCTLVLFTFGFSLTGCSGDDVDGGDDNGESGEASDSDAAASTGGGSGDGTSSTGGVDQGTGGNQSGSTGGACSVDCGGEATQGKVKTFDITFAGCSPDFGGALVVVANNDSLAISTLDSSVFSSIQFFFGAATGAVELSTAHRVDSGFVLNVTAGTTWTNISTDSVDPIGGTITINQYDEQGGIVDLLFSNVSIQNPSDKSVCTLNGTVVTTGLSF